MSKSLIFELIKILENSKFRFSNYQDLPGFIFEKIPELKKIKYKKNQLNLDNARYSWLKGLVDSEIQRVSEIGSNIGFFSFNMTNDFGVNYESYEVNKDYSEVNKKLSRLLKLNHLLKAYTISMNLKSLLDMKEHDLHINLNVLHHAGTAFDKDLINSQSDWFEYSKNYLGNLSKKGKYLFFRQVI